MEASGSRWMLLEVYEKCGNSWELMKSWKYWESVDIVCKSYGSYWKFT